MRYIIDKARNRTTHIMIYDDLSEQVRALSSLYRVKPQRLAVVDNLFKVSRIPDKAHRWMLRNDLHCMEDLERAVEMPWETGLKLVDEMLEKISHHRYAMPMSRRRSPEWSGDDGQFDYDRYADGQANFWQSTTRRDVSGQQFLTLVVDTGSCKNHRAEDILWSGIACIVVADTLERHGYSVAVVACNASKEGLIDNASRVACDTLSGVWLKRHDQPLDRSVLVNGTSPWYSRGVMMASPCLLNGLTPDKLFGYQKLLDARLVEYFAPIGYEIIDEIYNEATAIQAVEKLLSKFASPESDKMIIPGHDSGRES